MSRQLQFGILAATELTTEEIKWIGEAAERIAVSDEHLRRNLSGGTCMCGGFGHEDVIYSPTLIMDAEESLGVARERAERLVRAAEDAANPDGSGKWGF